MAAAIIALTLEANPDLTWRDIQHIMVRTSKPVNLKAQDWNVNGVDRNVSHSYGYGVGLALCLTASVHFHPIYV